MAVRFYRNASVGTPVVIREQAAQEYAPNPNADLPDVPFPSIMDQNARGHIISGPQ